MAQLLDDNLERRPGRISSARGETSAVYEPLLTLVSHSGDSLYVTPSIRKSAIVRLAPSKLHEDVPEVFFPQPHRSLLKITVIFLLIAILCNRTDCGESLPPAATSSKPGASLTTGTAQNRTESLKSEMNAAVKKVQEIVNQPVKRIPIQPGMRYSTYREGWFHPGAAKPDFNTIDIRPTQQTPYAADEYVTSDLNRGVVFRGPELEFNTYTKYFITDRTVPKKKLTEAEMLEINRLYRIIGRCEDELNKLKTSATPTP